MSHDDELVRKIVELEKRLDDLVQPEIGITLYPLTTPYTHASFSGNAFSTVAVNTLIDNAGWSTTIPADAVALLIRSGCRDSGSAAGAGLAFLLYSAAAAANAVLANQIAGVPNDERRTMTAVVPCTNGDIWYQINASGANTLDVWLYCFGYWR